MLENRKWKNWYKTIVLIAEVGLLYLSFYLSFHLRYKAIAPINYTAFQNTFPWIVLAFILLNLLFGIYTLYNKLKSDILILTVISQTILAILTIVASFIGRWLAFPRSVILIDYILSIVFFSLFRLFVFYLYDKWMPSKRIMIVGTKEDALAAVRNFVETKSATYRVSHIVVNHYIEHLKKHMGDFDILYIASPLERKLKDKLCFLAFQNKKRLFVTSIFENVLLLNSKVMNFQDESVMETSNFFIPPEMEIFKRAFDILSSLILLVLTSPILLITAILIKCTSKGPIFYTQTRVTKGGKEFEILKFRSMYTDAEKSGPMLATKNDARITPVGKFIRSTRIDELPQILNVLKGDMSMVGPRPERPFFIDQFIEENPYYTLRHNVRAGITGYAQVYGKYSSDYESKLKFDLLYIQSYSFLLDIRISLQTIKVLFDKVSSAGVEENEVVVDEEYLKKKSIKVLS